MGKDDFRNEVWVCLHCSSRSKSTNCPDDWHVDGYLITDICVHCKALRKYRSCFINSHIDGQPVKVTRGKIVDRECDFCLSLRKQCDCQNSRHKGGRMVSYVITPAPTSKLEQLQSMREIDRPRSVGSRERGATSHSVQTPMISSLTSVHSKQSSLNPANSSVDSCFKAHVNKEQRGRLQDQNSRYLSYNRHRATSSDSTGDRFIRRDNERDSRERSNDNSVNQSKYKDHAQTRDRTHVKRGRESSSSPRPRFRDVQPEQRAYHRNIHHSPDRSRVQTPILPGQPTDISTMITYLGFDTIARKTGLRVFRDRDLERCVATLLRDSNAADRRQVECMYADQVRARANASTKPAKVDPYDINAWLNVRPVVDPYACDQPVIVSPINHSPRPQSPLRVNESQTQQRHWSRQDTFVNDSDDEMRVGLDSTRKVGNNEQVFEKYNKAKKDAGFSVVKLNKSIINKGRKGKVVGSSSSPVGSVSSGDSFQTGTEESRQ